MSQNRPTERWTRDVCRIGQGHACCRYLVGDGTGLHCAKLRDLLAAVLDRRVEQKQMNARGNNCNGYAIEHVLT